MEMGKSEEREVKHIGGLGKRRMTREKQGM